MVQILGKHLKLKPHVKNLMKQIRKSTRMSDIHQAIIGQLL